MYEPLISVIVPIYNVEKYLADCLDSLFAQTYKNLELILVDDGSNAATKAILKRYESLPKVRVFHKENGGLSDARNYGLRHAAGDYISFIDGDNFIHPNLFEACVQTLQAFPKSPMSQKQ